MAESKRKPASKPRQWRVFVLMVPPDYSAPYIVFDGMPATFATRSHARTATRDNYCRVRAARLVLDPPQRAPIRRRK
jgi:hypothetical protein